MSSDAVGVRARPLAVQPQDVSHPVRYVRVAVLAYRRPDDIAAITLLLLAEAEQAQREGWWVSVLVVDNDPDAGARSIVAQLGDNPLLAYVHEPRPGISAARNRALRECDDWDLLVFIDDDERPSQGWLTRLLSTQCRYKADVVADPMQSRLGSDADEWVVQGGFFQRCHRQGLKTGDRITAAATNNLLLDLRTVRRLNLTFFEPFGLTGGEDSLFTRRLHSSGAKMVWCADAVVTEDLPTHRATRRWVLRRAFAFGNSELLTRVELAESPVRGIAERLKATIGGATRIFLGLVNWGIGKGRRSIRQHAQGLRMAANGAGMVAGALGDRHHEYGRPS